MKSIVIGLLLAASPAMAADGPPVAVVVASEAPPLERLAAEEVVEHFTRLFDARVETVATPPDGAAHVVLIGSPATNPAVKRAVGDAWPKLSPQGHVVKTVRHGGRAALVVGGGSPVATFWASSELAHRLGIRTLLFDNLLPAEAPEFTLDGFDATLEPLLERRAWTLMDASPTGWAAWGLADQKRVLRQLARLKFTRIVLPVEPWQPFVSWKFEGIEKRSAHLWPGGPIRVDGDTAGRAAFKGAALFDNPDFAGKTALADRLAAGVALLTGVIDECRRYGMTAALAVHPFEFPREFATVLPRSESSRRFPDLAVTGAPGAVMGDATTAKLAVAQLQALIATYPAADAIIVTPPGEQDDADKTWRALQDDGTIPADLALSEFVRRASRRKPLWTDDAPEQFIREQVSGLAAIRRLVEHPDVSRRKGGAPVARELASIDPALAWLALRITPAGVSTYAVPHQGEDVSGLGVADVRTEGLSAPLAWMNADFPVTPAFAQSPATLDRLQSRKWGGFAVRSIGTNGADPTALFVARRAFDPRLTPEISLRDLVDRVSGPGVADRVLKGLSLAQGASHEMPELEVSWDRDPARWVTGQAVAEPFPAAWVQRRSGYLEAMNEMYRANTRARDGARAFTLYYARRFEAAFEYLNALEAVRTSAAVKADDDEKRLAQIEKAIESLYAALNAHAAVARDPSDRGIIAILNEHGYRRLQRELE